MKNIGDYLSQQTKVNVVMKHLVFLSDDGFTCTHECAAEPPTAWLGHPVDPRQVPTI